MNVVVLNKQNIINTVFLILIYRFYYVYFIQCIDCIKYRDIFIGFLIFRNIEPIGCMILLNIIILSILFLHTVCPELTHDLITIIHKSLRNFVSQNQEFRNLIGRVN